MTTLAQLARLEKKLTREKEHGKITRSSSMWVPEEDEKLRSEIDSIKQPNGLAFKDGIVWMFDKKGALFRPVKEKTVLCGNVGLWQDDVLVLNRKAWIKEGACNKCQFHEKARKNGLGYATCAWQREHEAAGLRRTK